MLPFVAQTLLALVALFAAAPEQADGPADLVRSSAIRIDASSAPQSGKDISDAPSVANDRPKNPRVVFIISKDCPRCDEELARLRRPGGDFENMQARGWKIGPGSENHLQIVDRESVADLVEQLDVREFPTVACIADGQILRSFTSGCTTPLDAWTFGFLAKGIDERPPGSVPEAARVKSTGSYPLRGNHWSVEEDWNPTRDKVVAHLRGPNHGHQIRTAWKIESWSYEELRSLHDNLHEQEMGGVSYSQSSSRATDQFSAGRKASGR